jgi:predicted regulator of Ras-like GTPase activity (Roadblock/LC7/MglB family)
MKNLLEEIKTSPGVLGACVYSAKKGIVGSNLPATFNSEQQQRITSILHRVFRLNDAAKLDVNAYEIQYDEALLMARRLDTEATLVVVCAPDVNVPLVSMACGMQSAELLEAIAAHQVGTPPSPSPAPPAAEPAPAQAPEPTLTPAEVLKGPLADKLTGIKRALAKCIGPVAGMALDGALKTWLEKGEPTAERLKDLAELLLPEIDDDNEKAAFVQEVKKLL